MEEKGERNECVGWRCSMICELVVEARWGVGLDLKMKNTERREHQKESRNIGDFGFGVV